MPSTLHSNRQGCVHVSPTSLCRRLYSLVISCHPRYARGVLWRTCRRQRYLSRQGCSVLVGILLSFSFHPPFSYHPLLYSQPQILSRRVYCSALYFFSPVLAPPHSLGDILRHG